MIVLDLSKSLFSNVQWSKTGGNFKEQLSRPNLIDCKRSIVSPSLRLYYSQILVVSLFKFSVWCYL